MRPSSLDSISALTKVANVSFDLVCKDDLTISILLLYTKVSSRSRGHAQGADGIQLRTIVCRW